MSRRRVGAGEYVLMDSHCAKGEQSNLEANKFLAKECAEEHNGEDAEDMKIKGKMHCCRLQEQQREVGKVAVEEVPPPMGDKEPKAGGGGDKKI